MKKVYAHDVYKSMDVNVLQKFEGRKSTTHFSYIVTWNYDTNYPVETFTDAKYSPL